MAFSIRSDDYPPSAFYFTVSFARVSGITDSSFQDVSGITAEMDLEELVEGGENRFVHRLPKGVKHPKLVLKRGIASKKSPLVIWCRTVLEGEFLAPIVPMPLVVSLLNEKGRPHCVWSFVNAFPTQWEVEEFKSTKNEVAIEKIELSYTYSNRLL